jgi:hypothetical protein
MIASGIFPPFNWRIMMDEQAIAIFCICDEVVKFYGSHENLTCKMTNAEVMTFAIISSLHYRADYRITRLVQP